MQWVWDDHSFNLTTSMWTLHRSTWIPPRQSLIHNRFWGTNKITVIIMPAPLPPHSNSHISVLWLIQHLHTRCSPAVQSTTISSGVSSMMSRLEMGRSVVPPSLPLTDSRSLCHFSWSSLGTSYIVLVKCGVIQNELSTSTKSLHMHWSNGELLTYILKFGIKSYAWTSPNLNIPAVYAFDKCIPT